MLQIKNIKKKYQTGDLIQKALDDVSLNLRDNEFVAILGPSGSGKTTLLNIIGGLDHYDEGDLIINSISTSKYTDRDWDSYRNHTIGFVFQSYNLIPHQTLLANVELALTISGISKSERRQRALKALEDVGLKEQANKIPNQLSGGQMQRVAIARALVNNPDILLADEPTGALDSETSIQVMDLLKEVAKDRLVVMVTHNPELAYKYATRIVELKDGKIINDSDPFKDVDNFKAIKYDNMGKSSMSLMMSLQLSFNNLKTKKARTFLTAFAGSIGIIGIALILSISTGVNDYISSIEQDTLSEYPLVISSSGLNISSMIGNNNEDSTQEEAEIRVSNMISTLFSSFSANDLESLKDYLENGDSDIKEHARAIEYEFNVTPHIYSSDTSSIHQVNPDKTFASLGLGSSSSGNTMLSSTMSTDVFYKLPKESSLYEEQYDIKAGKWPERYDECVLVLSSEGKMSDLLLYSLDLKDYDELVQMIDDFAANKNVEADNGTLTYRYEDVLYHEFKLVNPSDYYQYDSQYHLYVDKTKDEDYMKKLIADGETIKIVGIVQPKENSDIAMLQSGIYYHDSLIEHIIGKTVKSDAYLDQIANPDIDIFTGSKFGEDNNNSFDLNSLFTIDKDIMAKAITIDKDAIGSFDLDLSNIKFDLNDIDINLDEIFQNISIDISQEDLEQLSQNIQDDFINYCILNDLFPEMGEDGYNVHFITYINSEEGQAFIKGQLASLLINSGLTEDVIDQIIDGVKQSIEDSQSQILKKVADEISSQINNAMANTLNNLPKAIKFDTEVFMNGISFNMTEEELSELMVSMMSTNKTSYENNLRSLGYADTNKPSSISIYPIDFENKTEVIDILDNYNEHMAAIDEDKVINYTDYVGTLMTSVTDIINVISYVLIAFVAISLIVSSIMIGVITYISVLERKKEIGILRAIGASKRNISTVFNAETFMIGLLSGLMGIGISLLMLVPINAVIHSIANTTTVNAKLPVAGAISLIVLSVLLTILGGLIPSSKASKEDPVKALRSE